MIDFSLLVIRLHKMAVAISHLKCWRPLLSGVAPTVEHLGLLRKLDVDGVIDVGANRGQFSMACRLALKDVPIVAFEPIPAEAAVFKKVHGHLPHVTLIESALGETKDTATLHLSKSADSSSLLPIGKRQTELFENTVEVGTIEVPVQRLDDLSDHWTGRTRLLLKLDVQGFELNVLRGAVATLKACAYVYAECSEVALYEGQALRAEVEAFLSLQGFVLQRRHNEQWANRELIQADYLFSRSGV